MTLPAIAGSPWARSGTGWPPPGAGYSASSRTPIRIPIPTRRCPMLDDTLHEQLAGWVRPLVDLPVPDVRVLRRRARRRVMRRAAVAAAMTVVVAAASRRHHRQSALGEAGGGACRRPRRGQHFVVAAGAGDLEPRGVAAGRAAPRRRRRAVRRAVHPDPEGRRGHPGQAGVQKRSDHRHGALAGWPVPRRRPVRGRRSHVRAGRGDRGPAAERERLPGESDRLRLRRAAPGCQRAAGVPARAIHDPRARRRTGRGRLRHFAGRQHARVPD